MPLPCALDAPLPELCQRAAALRDSGKGRTITFSPKVFIPLTRLCRDQCGYCAYRREPGDGQPFLTPDQVLRLARAGEKAGCREALFVLGERPEQRYPEARHWLRRRGFESSIHYLLQMCRVVLENSSLYPHSNPGIVNRAEMEALREVNISLGLMLESTSSRLGLPGGPHQKAPSKRPAVRLRVLERAGRLQIPWTTGLLIGIGETMRERVESLLAIRDLQRRFGHIQEVIIQNFRPKPGTGMAGVRALPESEVKRVAALARIILGERINLQVPPNLSRNYLQYLEAGINDWGGISPLTRDWVNPEAAWPQLELMSSRMGRLGYRLRARFALYPEFVTGGRCRLPAGLGRRLRKDADREGYPTVGSFAAPRPALAGCV